MPFWVGLLIEVIVSIIKAWISRNGPMAAALQASLDEAKVVYQTTGDVGPLRALARKALGRG